MHEAAGREGRPNVDGYQPTSVLVGVWLVVTAAVLWLPVVSRAGDTTGSPFAGTLVFACVVCAFRSLKGRCRARTATAVLAVLLFLLLGWTARLPGGDSSGGTPHPLLAVTAAAASFAGAVLLFVPPSSAYYRACRLQRSGGTQAGPRR